MNHVIQFEAIKLIECGWHIKRNRLAVLQPKYLAASVLHKKLKYTQKDPIIKSITIPRQSIVFQQSLFYRCDALMQCQQTAFNKYTERHPLLYS